MIQWITAVFYFNLLLLVGSLIAEIVLLVRLWKCNDLAFWIGIIRIIFLFLAACLVVWLNANHLVPTYTPMRFVLSLVLLRVAVRDLYELVANR